MSAPAPKRKIRRFFTGTIHFGLSDPKGSRYLVQGCGNRTLCPTGEKLIGQTGRRYRMKVVFPKPWVDKLGRRAVVEDRRVNSRGEAAGEWRRRAGKKLSKAGSMAVGYKMRHGAHHLRVRIVGKRAASAGFPAVLGSPAATVASSSVSPQALQMAVVGANLVEFTFANSTDDELRITYPLWQTASSACGQATASPCPFNNGEFTLPARVDKSTPSTVRMIFINPVSSAGNWTVQETSCFGACSTYYTDWSAQLTQIGGGVSCPFGILTNAQAWFAGVSLADWIAIVLAVVAVAVIIAVAGPALVTVAAEATAEGVADATADGLVDVAADDTASESSEEVAEQVPQDVVEDGGETQVSSIPSDACESPAEDARNSRKARWSSTTTATATSAVTEK